MDQINLTTFHETYKEMRQNIATLFKQYKNLQKSSSYLEDRINSHDQTIWKLKEKNKKLHEKLNEMDERVQHLKTSSSPDKDTEAINLSHDSNSGLGSSLTITPKDEKFQIMEAQIMAMEGKLKNIDDQCFQWQKQQKPLTEKVENIEKLQRLLNNLTINTMERKKLKDVVSEMDKKIVTNDAKINKLEHWQTSIEVWQTTVDTVVFSASTYFNFRDKGTGIKLNRYDHVLVCNPSFDGSSGTFSAPTDGLYAFCIYASRGGPQAFRVGVKGGLQSGQVIRQMIGTTSGSEAQVNGVVMFKLCRNESVYIDVCRVRDGGGGDGWPVDILGRIVFSGWRMSCI